jgi:hypothetical protein
VLDHSQVKVTEHRPFAPRFADSTSQGQTGLFSRGILVPPALATDFVHLLREDQAANQIEIRSTRGHLTKRTIKHAKAGGRVAMA